MPQSGSGGQRRNQPKKPQGPRPGPPQKKPVKKGPQPHQKPTPKPQWKPPVYRRPPVRRTVPAGLGLMGAVGILIFVGVLVAVMGGIGGGSDTPAAPPAPGPLPSVSIEGAIPCVVSGKPTYLSADRLQTCVDAKLYAKAKLVQAYGVAEGTHQFGDCLDHLWKHEANWSAWADNPTSSAYGIPQAIESIHGHVYDIGDWRTQVDWGINYIGGRYKTPCGAWTFWQRTDPRPNPGHWY